MTLLPRVVIVCLLLSAQGCYYLQAVRGQVELLANREPVARLIESADTPEPLREQLRTAQRARAFAVTELGLPDNRSYLDYVELEREHVVWNVVAAPEFSLQPLRWCYPFAGCVSYRGYFREASALRFAERQRARGHDVRVAGVSAYSTLGWFADPLLSTMLRGDETTLVATIFHELAHQRLYVRDDSRFNEAFATVVEEEGMRRWLAARERPDLHRAYTVRQQRRDGFARLVAETRDELRTLYESGAAPDAMRAGKSAAFARLRDRYHALRDGEWEGYRGYDNWFERELNNADLAAVGTYNDRAPELRALLAAAGGDLDEFYRRAAEVGQRAR